MTKIQYPTDGLAITATGSSQQAIDSLNSAIGQCDFDVPYDFPYRDWIYNLRRQLEECRNEIQGYDNKVKNTDTLVQNTTNETVSLISKLPAIEIEQRQRMIKE